ncbi:hypothetical protein BEL04_19875 [Mucilaginibacter sp. PPCGB 2223]|uniref:AtpZ/AtpI family protein n=1 Tax=Mucilaginibacter sp. PPCGB 2223 TaxID=1886027 RepID=UPI000826FBAA|nr:AtpZ/AtpI family protein [Mucilaginibacter sp. PPCGB 2223]OCX50980.1 hypothetical protein BEL04_19875 [Mucilaginibacter sp. PPCGB 2223]
MAELEPENNGDVKNNANNYAKYSSVVFQMAAVIGLFTYAGYKLDACLKHDVQWITALLALTGVCLSIYLTVRQLSK